MGESIWLIGTKLNRLKYCFMAIGFNKFTIKIDEIALKKTSEGFRSLSVSQSIGQFHSLKLVFRKDALETGNELLNKSIDYIGKRIEVYILTEKSESSGKEEEFSFSGIISGISSSRTNSFSGDSIIISGTGPDVVLADGGHTQSFSDKNLSDITDKVLSEYKLQCESSITPSSKTGPHSYIVQYNETAFAFLNRIACKYGQWFYYNGSKLVFGEPEPGDTVELKFGQNLFEFNLKIDIQPFTFSMVAYDYKDTDDQVYLSEDASQEIELSKIGKRVAKNSEDLFTHESKILYNHHLTTGSQKEHLDHRVFLKKSGKGSGMVVCSGESDCPLLRIGGIIKLSEKSGKSTTNHGTYRVVDLQHSMKWEGEYSNSFTAIPEECKIPYTANPHSIPVCETQSAIVVENEDPDQMGRIRVRFFWQEDEMSPWLRIVNPYGGQEKGHMFIPEIDEEVLVGFEGGNAEKPFVLGALYHAKALPDDWKPDSNDIKAIRTRSGHTIEFRDTEGEEEIWLYDYNKENYFIKLKSHAQEITIEALEHIELKAKNISILAEKDLIFEATDTTTKAGGNISNEASGNISNKASGNMDNEASANMTVKGGANTTVEAGTMLEEKASMVKIN